MSFSTSLSGLAAQQQKLDVIGTNLSNINTVGYKASTVQFSDLVSQSVGGTSANPSQIGLGVTTGSISPSFTQGGIQNTGVATNVAIQGSGFFVIGATSARAYTRAGNFGFDANGQLVTADGRPVQGYTALNAAGQIVTSGQPGNITVPPGVLRAPSITNVFSTTSNLDSNAVTGSTFTTSPQVFDSLGQAHVLTITYTKAAAAGTWTYAVSAPGAEVTGGTAGTPFPLVATGGGSIVFNASGTLTTPAADVTITGPAWNNGATAGTAINWDIWNANASPVVATLTGFASPSATSSITANGSAAGSISGITIDSAGRMNATFGAGASIVVGQLALANFNNPQGLVKLGSNLYGESASAGNSNVGTAGTGGRGDLIGSALEDSNVDMAKEFTQMILAQRGYQANSKGITTTDELMQVTLSLKQ